MTMKGTTTAIAESMVTGTAETMKIVIKQMKGLVLIRANISYTGRLNQRN